MTRCFTRATSSVYNGAVASVNPRTEARSQTRKKSKTRAELRDQAEQTRTRILDAAYELLCAEGSESATMQRIADRAGVAVQTVYLGFRNKPGLITAVEQRAVLGEATPDQWREQPWAKALATETDPGRLLRAFVEADTQIKARLSPLAAALVIGRPGDPTRNQEQEQGRDGFFASIVDRLIALDALRETLTRERALDIVRALDDLTTFTDLTTRRGWTTDEWSTWLTDLLQNQLLRTPTPDRPLGRSDSPGDPADRTGTKAEVILNNKPETPAKKRTR